MNKDEMRLILQVEAGGKKYKIEKVVSCFLIAYKIIPFGIFKYILSEMEKEMEKELAKDFTKVCSPSLSGVYEYDWSKNTWVGVPEEKLKEERIKRMRVGLYM